MGQFSKITGVGGYVPPKVVTNDDLKEMMETSDEWITQRTGIKTRHWVESNVSTSDLALNASLEAIQNAGLDKTEIDMIVLATLSPDHDFPGTGCFLQAKLDLPEITVLDIRQQCSGFLYALNIADNFIKAGTHNNILVVGAEIHSKGLDKTPEGRNVGVLFGDGAGAVIVSKTQVNDPKIDSHLIAHSLHADGKYAKNLWLASPGSAIDENRVTEKHLEQKLHFPQMDGKTVFVHATKKMSECLLKVLKENKVSIKDVDLFLFHQANLRINSKVAELLEIPDEKIFNTIQKFANTTAATIPLGMKEAIKEGVLKPGQLVACAAFGSGFTWGASLFRY